MSTPTLTRADVRQLPTHAHLYADTPPELLRGSRRAAPDAIIVPASRPASALIRLIDLAARLGTQLVLLCSKKTKVEQVAERMHQRIGLRGIIVRIDEDYVLPGPAFATSHPDFSVVNGGRWSDLSTKRNAGLWLARLMGWEKIVFIDDDMTVDPLDIVRIVNQLDRFPIAGMRSWDYPDNSVVCHARRVAKLRQGVFVSGAVLGVNCARRDLGFFPDVYNEDWFFFGEAAATRGLPRPGTAVQGEYDPFTTKRAGHEEFGDLLAEGLYSLIARSGADSFEDVVELASAQYWADFIDARQETIADVQVRLRRLLDQDNCDDRKLLAAITALDASARRYAGLASITEDDCGGFLDLWRKDSAEWRNALPEPLRFRSTCVAMDELGIQADHWCRIR